MSHRWRKIVFGLLVTLLPVHAKAQLLAAHVDMALLATQTYNAGVELTVSGSHTLGLSIAGNYHPWILKDMRCIALQPEWRYYYSGRPMMSNFVGVSAIVTNYDYTWKDERHHGDAVGAGLSFGHVMPLSQRLNLDFHASVGLWFYHEQGHSLSVKVLPTKIGVSLAYIIK